MSTAAVSPYRVAVAEHSVASFGEVRRARPVVGEATACAMHAEARCGERVRQSLSDTDTITWSRIVANAYTPSSKP